MISVGEESGALDDMLEEVGQMYQREVEYELKTLGQQIEPILIVCLGRAWCWCWRWASSCRCGTSARPPSSVDAAMRRYYEFRGCLSS